MAEQKNNKGKSKVKHDVSSEAQETRQQLYGKPPYQLEETVVSSKSVSDFKKGLVRTTDVQTYLRKLKLLESKKKKETSGS